MKNLRKNIALRLRSGSFKKSISRISRNANVVNTNKEEILLNRISEKLGKSTDDIRTLISDDLLSLLSTVPFTRS